MTRRTLRPTRAAVAAAFAAQGLAYAIILTHLPQFEARYGIDDAAVTGILLGVTLLAGAGSLLAERVAAARSSAAALRAGLALVALGAAGAALAPEVPWLVAAFAFYGVGVGVVDAAGNMQAVAVQRLYGRSILTSFHAAWSAAAITGALIVAGGERVGLPLTPSVLVAAATALAVLGVAGPRLLAGTSPPTASPAAQLRTAAPATGPPGPGLSGTGLSGTGLSGTGLSGAGPPAPDGTEDTGGGHAPGPGAAVAGAAVPWRPVVLLGAAMACFYVADSAVASWSAIYLHDLLLAPGGTAALAYAAYQATGLLSRVAGDHAVRRFGMRAVLAGASIVGTAGLALAVAAPGPWTAIAGFALVGCGLPLVAPLVFSAAGRLAPGSADAVVARVNVFNYAGAITGSVAVGGVGALTSLRVGFAVPLVLALALLALVPAFDPARRVRG